MTETNQINVGTLSKCKFDSEQVPLKKVKNSFSLNESLYLDKEDADVEFIFESSDERIPAHKCILKRSPVFKAAFYGSMPSEDEIKIKDECVDADAFKVFLQFFYLTEVELSMKHIQSVMHLCHKYQMDECFTICSTFLKANISINELCLGYQLAIYYEQNDLKDFFLLQIGVQTKEVLKSNGFLNCYWMILNEIVKSAVLNCREFVLLEACIDWARSRCERKKVKKINRRKIRKELKGIICDVRFNGFTLAEFREHLQDNPLNIYNDNEMKDITRIMAKKPRKKHIKSTKFNCSKRIFSFDSIPWNNLAKLQCQRWDKYIHDYNVPNIVTTIFSSSKSLIFKRFVVRFKPYNQIVDCAISVEAMGLDLKTEVITFAEQLIIPERSYKAIYLPKPIIVMENVKYKIQLNFSSNNNIQLTYDYNLKQEVELSNGAQIKFHRDESSSFDTVGRGVILWLSFNKMKILK